MNHLQIGSLVSEDLHGLKSQMVNGTFTFSTPLSLISTGNTPTFQLISSRLCDSGQTEVLLDSELMSPWDWPRIFPNTVLTQQTLNSPRVD